MIYICMSCYFWSIFAIEGIQGNLRNSIPLLIQNSHEGHVLSALHHAALQNFQAITSACYHTAMSSTSESTITPAVPLRRGDANSKSQKAPVWAIDAAEPGVAAPLPAKCARHSRADGICCKELKGDERTLIDPDIVRDV